MKKRANKAGLVSLAKHEDLPVRYILADTIERRNLGKVVNEGSGNNFMDICDMNTADKSLIYKTIFERKGGEGLNTKVITEANKKDYGTVFSNLEENEKPLLIYYANLLNWFLLTNDRVLMSTDGVFSSLYLTDLVEVYPALKHEMKDGIMDKQKFTRLKLKTKNGEYFLCKLEQGPSYEGVYQVLHFIASNNIN